MLLVLLDIQQVNACKFFPAMLLSQLKLSICHVHKDSNLLVPNCGYVVELIRVGPKTTALTASASFRKKVSSLVTSVSLCIVPHCSRDLYANIGTTEVVHVLDSYLKEDSQLLEEQSLTEDTRGENVYNLSKSSTRENEREMERRRKIGIANKGKVPWNKGRKHSEEIREIISRRTKEAMRDPKVRRKMSECPRSLSNQTKARISMSHRKLWGERLKWKRSREKIFQIWAESIARAAKMGGSDQQELEWDSFEEIKIEMHLEQLEWAAQRAKEKETTLIRAERTAKEREAKKSRLAQKKMEQEEKAKVVGESKRKAGKQSKEDREDLAGNQEFKLRRNLMKIRKQKSRVSRISNQYQRTWENLDMKLERTEPNHTLADQIRLAKFRRAALSLRKL